MVYPYFSRISYQLKKKGEINATKQSVEIDILYALVRKIKFDLILQKMTYFKKLLLKLLLKKKKPNDDALFEVAICKDYSLTLYRNIKVYSSM